MKIFWFTEKNRCTLCFLGKFLSVFTVWYFIHLGKLSHIQDMEIDWNKES